MYIIRRAFFASIFLINCLVAFSQKENLPVKEVNGTAKYYYEVSKGETIYSIAKKLGISQEEIERENPSVVQKGLKAGQTLYFNVKTTGGDRRFHIVQAKETVYGIAKKYGITQNELAEWNPEVKDGIRPGQKLYVSAADNVEGNRAGRVTNPSDQPSNDEYVIKEGESLYRIAIEHNTTVDKILALNPDLDRERYQAGTVIKLSESERKTFTSHSDENTQPNSQRSHLVKSDETFFSIARQYGITVNELEIANPEVGLLREGMVLTIPLNELESVAEESREIASQSPTPDDFFNPVDSVVSNINQKEEPIKIALILPLKISDKTLTKQAQLYREFYKGFLVGIDSIGSRYPLDIKVFDSKGSLTGLQAVLKDEDLKDARVILAPDDAKSLEMLADFGSKYNIDILNLFVVNDQSYKTNPFIFQGNIPHEIMYDKAVEGIFLNNPSSIPVILSRKGGSNDKEEFIKLLKSKLASKNIEYKEIEFETSLTKQHLADFYNSKNYIFIPVSSKQAELNKILPALTAMKSSADFKGNITLAGYPEWVTFKGEVLKKMHSLNTVIYSRFFTGNGDYLQKRVADSYKKWYGHEMGNYLPQQGLIGFDAAAFLIDWLNAEVRLGEKIDDSKAYYGVQNGFNFKKVADSEGKVNTCLFLINYRPNGTVDKTVL
ncbi:MAG: LysM peptidoglycan-binding domain-containing protein [Paramuribaculum sp.]|nr:LysM peptidoglycan-binding domain-containing protein [Paramuribaculum sp.]